MAVASLKFGFYGEGVTDDRFLPAIIVRTARKILDIHGRYELDVLEPILVSRSIMANCSSGDERIMQAARKTMGCDVLVIHLDADAPDAQKTLDNRFKPGAQKVYEAEENLCRCLVPLVPVRMSAAWMIADGPTLVTLLSPTLKLDELRASKEIRLPRKPHEVESNVDPKQTLSQIIGFSQSHRRRASRRVNPTDIQVQLGGSIRLDKLEKVPSYGRFVQDMTQALISIGMAE